MQWEVTRELITNNKVLKCECDFFHELDHIRNLYTNMTLTDLLSWRRQKFLVLKPFHWLQPAHP